MNKFLAFLFVLLGVFLVVSAAPAPASAEVKRLTKLLNEVEPGNEPEDLKASENRFFGYPGFGYGGFPGGFGYGGYGGYGGFGGYGGYGGYGFPGHFGGFRGGFGSFSGSWGK